MKKSKLVAVLLIGVLLTLGLIFAGCDDPCPKACWARYSEGSGNNREHSTCGEDKCTAYKHSVSGMYSYDVKCDC